jgi:hypothetical protein
MKCKIYIKKLPHSSGIQTVKLNRAGHTAVPESLPLTESLSPLAQSACHSNEKHPVQSSDLEARYFIQSQCCNGRHKVPGMGIFNNHGESRQLVLE